MPKSLAGMRVNFFADKYRLLCEKYEEKMGSTECCGCEKAELCKGGLKRLPSSFYVYINRREQGCAKKPQIYSK